MAKYKGEYCPAIEAAGERVTLLCRLPMPPEPLRPKEDGEVQWGGAEALSGAVSDTLAGVVDCTMRCREVFQHRFLLARECVQRDYYSRLTGKVSEMLGVVQLKSQTVRLPDGRLLADSLLQPRSAGTAGDGDELKEEVEFFDSLRNTRDRRATAAEEGDPCSLFVASLLTPNTSSSHIDAFCAHAILGEALPEHGQAEEREGAQGCIRTVICCHKWSH